MNNYQRIGFDTRDNYIKQIWIKTDNSELINFIKDYDWNNLYSKISVPYIPTWRVEKIILEEFYGVKGDKSE